MAIIYAAASANWSLTSTWSGGVLPANGDEIRLGAYTVEMDIDETPLLLAIKGQDSTGADTAGQIHISSASAPKIIHAETIQAGSKTTGVIYNQQSSYPVDIYGNVAAGTGSCVYCTTGTVTIHGNVSGGSGPNVSGARVSGSTILSIYGNVSAGTATKSYGVNHMGVGLTIHGNILGGTGTTAYGVYSTTSTSDILVTIIGNITGGSGTTACGFYNSAGSTVSITGDITGGGIYDAYGVYHGVGIPATVAGNLIYSASTCPIIGAFTWNRTALNYIEIGGTKFYHRNGPVIGSSFIKGAA